MTIAFHPKVSIIIPVYNGANYLREAIESALHQTYDNIEVIVVNDGSDDGGATEQIARSYGDRIRYARKDNGGVASALNTGIRAMAGEYVSCLPHDDVYDLHKIQVQIDHCCHHPGEDVILYSDYEYIDELSRFLKASDMKPSSPKVFLFDMVMDYPINGCTALIPKRCLDAVGFFDERLRITQDYEMWFRLARRFPLLCLPHRLVKSRLYAQQVRYHIKEEHLRELNQLYISFVDQMPLRAISAVAPGMTMRGFYSDAAASFRRRGFCDATRYVETKEKQEETSRKILLVAMIFSIHAKRWIKQLMKAGHDIHLFPSMDWGEDLDPEIAHHPRVVAHGFGLDGDERVSFVAGYHEMVQKPASVVEALAKVVRRVQPDIIHSLEMQQAGYLVAQTKNVVLGIFPRWIVTNWGSDIYACGRLLKHEAAVRDVLIQGDCYSCEGQRDISLASEYGFKGKVLPVVPNVGGFPLARMKALRDPRPPSMRRTIMLKGYQHEYGRALVGLRALERCADLLKSYEIVIYSAQASPSVPIAAELFTKRTGINTRIIPYTTDVDVIYRNHGLARVSIGLSISDGIPISVLEAMMMGSFPIQSWTSCANEWIVDGETGILVPPEDPEIVEQAIRRALTDDALVDRAAEANWKVACERLDEDVVLKKIQEFYRIALEGL